MNTEGMRIGVGFFNSQASTIDKGCDKKFNPIIVGRYR